MRLLARVLAQGAIQLQQKFDGLSAIRIICLPGTCNPRVKTHIANWFLFCLCPALV